MEHPVLMRIRREGFEPLGWFESVPEDRVPHDSKFVILIGNAGPAMFNRFARERNPNIDLLDDWTRAVVNSLAGDLDAKAIYPFDKPPQPFLTWARRGKAGHVSPLGLNIHGRFGLWHAYRAALLFPVVFDFPPVSIGAHPCESCTDKPCLSACPVSAFDGKSYEVAACGRHLRGSAGQTCMSGGCLARLACPVGTQYVYSPKQVQFHMKAFELARRADP